MKTTLTTLLSFGLLISGLLVTSGCSNNLFAKENPVLKNTIIKVSAEYLESLIRGDAARVNSQIFWSRFLPSKRQPYSKSDFAAQLALLDARWTKAEHPLINLDLVDISTNDDVAKIKLRRIDLENAPTIKLEMSWSGAGWLVSEDNLFGKEGLFGSLKKLSVNEKKRANVIKHRATFWR
jgi:hypothetical protein